MDCDLIYPSESRLMRTAPSIIAAAYFNEEELVSFGVEPSALELNEAFVDDNELEKVFRLWASPVFLHRFFNEHKDYFTDKYWNDITEAQFVYDVMQSVRRIRRRLSELFSSNGFSQVVEPLDQDEEELRLHQSIKVKIKQGRIHNRFAFRFYAIEIEEGKCYLITGATIKVHKDMMKAPNTVIEMKKLNFALRELNSEGIDTKELFIDFMA